MADPALAIAVPLIAGFEGFSATPYQDQAGIWTIGYGFTAMPDGSKVTADTPALAITEALVILNAYVAKTLAAVRAMVEVDITNHQAAALTSLAYNIGTGALRGSSLLRLLNAGGVRGAAYRFSAWDYVGKTVNDGLRARRSHEQTVFDTPDPPPIGAIVMSTSTPPSATPSSLPYNTTDQPPFAVAHIVAHPGSTMAGISAILVGVGQMLATTTLPTNPMGWAMFGLSLLAGIGGMLGK